jgi:polar amino acid transport system substrate-binding protein
MKKWMLMLVAVVTTFLAACGNGEEETATDAEGTPEGQEELIVGIDDTFAPMSYRDANGDIVGFDVDLAEAAGEIMGVNFTFQPIDWIMKETELNEGKIDLIWNGYTMTEERAELVNFSDPYLENRQIIVVPADSDIETKEDLAGKTVATQQASSTLDAIEADESNIDEDFEGGEPVLYPTFTDVFNDLDSGRSDAIIADEVLARYIMGQKGPENYKVLEDNFGDEQFAVGLRKEDTELAEELNAALDEVKSSGQYDEIYAKWFDGEDAAE